MFWDLLLVTEPSEAKHDESGEDVRRSDKAVGGSSAEPHAILEDDGEEVCNRISNRGGKHEYAGKAPHLEVKGVL